MLCVDGVTRTIKLCKGDTGSIQIDTGCDTVFGDHDIAILTVYDRCDQEVIQKVLIPENGKFFVRLLGRDTEELPDGLYTWKARFILSPYFDSEGNLVNWAQNFSTAPMTMQLMP